MPRSSDRHPGVEHDDTRQIPRLRRIEGQVRGLQQMIEDGRYCIDIAHQINAVIAALRRVQADMLRDHLQAIATAKLKGDMPETEGQRFADELSRLITKMI